MTSFLKRITDAIDSMAYPDMEFFLVLSKQYYFLGDNIEGTITFTPHENLEIEQVKIKLTCVERIQRKNQIKNATLYDDSQIIPLKFRIVSGMIKQTTFNLNVPFTGRPTFKSIEQNIDWSLALTIESKEKRSLQKSYTIQVAKPQPGQVPPIIQKETLTEIEILFCRHCGTKNNARSTYCCHCGASLN